MTKKTNAKQYIYLACAYGAIFAIYNIIIMLLFDNKNAVFWTSYGFMCAGLAANILVAVISFTRSDVEAAFMGIPLFSFSVFYVGAELFISFVFMLFRAVVGIKLTIAVQAIALLIFVIFAVLALASKDAVETINKKVDSSSKAIKLLSVDVKLLEDQCMDKELKAELHKVAEAIRYSDPMTNDAVADLDSMIQAKITELKHYCNSNNKNEAMQACYQLNAFVSERNQKLLLTK